MRVRLTDKGRNVHKVVSDIFARHADALSTDPVVGGERIRMVNDGLGQMERFWSDQIRYIY